MRSRQPANPGREFVSCSCFPPPAVTSTLNRMGSSLTTIGLPVALGIIMFGLGLTLTPADFGRVAKHPKAVVIALVCQLVLLPALCFGLVLMFGLPPVLAVGMMLLAASPGGTTANLYSHLFRGDVALNISLTAINSVIAVVTLPIIVNFSLDYFMAGDDQIGFQFGKSVEVFAIVLLPVAARHDRPGAPPGVCAVHGQAGPHRLGDHPDRGDRGFDRVEPGPAGRELRTAESDHRRVLPVQPGARLPAPADPAVSRSQSIASSFEIGIHNATLAIVIAQTVIGSVEMSLPAGVYGVLMFFLAAGFGFLIRGRSGQNVADIPTSGSPSAIVLNHSAERHASGLPGGKPIAPDRPCPMQWPEPHHFRTCQEHAVLATRMSIEELSIPATLDEPAAADFIEMVAVRNAIEAGLLGSDALACTPAELLPVYQAAEFEPKRIFVAKVDGRTVGRSDHGMVDRRRHHVDLAGDRGAPGVPPAGNRLGPVRDGGGPRRRLRQADPAGGGHAHHDSRRRAAALPHRLRRPAGRRPGCAVPDPPRISPRTDRAGEHG